LQDEHVHHLRWIKKGLSSPPHVSSCFPNQHLWMTSPCGNAPYPLADPPLSPHLCCTDPTTRLPSRPFAQPSVCSAARIARLTLMHNHAHAHPSGCPAKRLPKARLHAPNLHAHQPPAALVSNLHRHPPALNLSAITC
jgi:hypothetical protein